MNIQKLDTKSSPFPRVRLITNQTYQNTSYWFDQTRRDWQMDLLVPDVTVQYKKHPLILWLSGGSWQMADRSSYLPELVTFAQTGFVVASTDYHMGSEGQFPVQLQDVRHALDYLAAHEQDYHLNLTNITLMGDSAGGYLALMAGYTMNRTELLSQQLGNAHPIRQIVGFYAPTDLGALREFYQANIPENKRFDYSAPLNFFLGSEQPSQKLLQAASPIHYVQSQLPRTLLLQGDHDQWVPYEQAEVLAEKLEQAGNDITIFKLPGGRHIDSRFFSLGVKAQVLKFLQFSSH